MRVLFLGDIVGRPGLMAICQHLPAIRQEFELDIVIANAENVADGSGMMPAQFKSLVEAGVDGVTMGDHIYRKLEIKQLLQDDPRIVKPGNYPAEAPGRPWTVIGRRGGNQVALLSLLGRVFMRPVDCPFAAADRWLAQLPESVKVRIVDIHAEATSDKQTLARYLDGRVTAVLGTHTHVPTADAQLLPAGTAYITDVGMTGPYAGVIGRQFDRVLATTVTFEPVHFHVAQGDVRICGAVIRCDPQTGQAISIDRFERPV
jgi:metallophosphoesterase (TIGR00282 family)